MSTTNHYILYFVRILGIYFPNKGNSLWKAQTAFCDTGSGSPFCHKFSAAWLSLHPLVPAFSPVSVTSLVFAMAGYKMQKVCNLPVRLCELWRIGVAADRKS
jgi:hypothetical protein